MQIADTPFDPKPVQKPHIPIWIGGESPPALRRAGRLGDACIRSAAIRNICSIRPAAMRRRRRAYANTPATPGATPPASCSPTTRFGTPRPMRSGSARVNAAPSPARSPTSSTTCAGSRISASRTSFSTCRRRP
ncbi:MAG: LLM class flavin-dependent oxidoreductase [Alphaproteobacteria bacterium]|nr:LLM class flavin-dependent oxidoreductase [Alphaproteobacteria bacterium]